MTIVGMLQLTDNEGVGIIVDVRKRDFVFPVSGPFEGENA